jgi:hypothetical protein
MSGQPTSSARRLSARFRDHKIGYLLTRLHNSYGQPVFLPSGSVERSSPRPYWTTPSCRTQGSVAASPHVQRAGLIFAQRLCGRVLARSPASLPTLVRHGRAYSRSHANRSALGRACLCALQPARSRGPWHHHLQRLGVLRIHLNRTSKRPEAIHSITDMHCPLVTHAFVDLVPFANGGRSS